MEVGIVDVAGTGVVGVDEADEIDPGVEGKISTDNSKRTDLIFVIMRCRLSFVILTSLLSSRARSTSAERANVSTDSFDTANSPYYCPLMIGYVACK
jgi:hypothetical protein